MNALFIVLNDVSYLDDILNKFLELKVKGATIIDSQGMASAIFQLEGFFKRSPFQRSLDDDQLYSKTIFTVIPKDQDIEVIVKAVEEIVSLSKRQVIGFMFTMPVSGIYPMKPRISKKD